MLILTRKPQEVLTIIDTLTGEELKIMLIEVKGKQARVGIEASPRFQVHRAEVWERMKEET